MRNLVASCDIGMLPDLRYRDCRYELLGLVVQTSLSLSCAVSLENFRSSEKVKVWSHVAVWLSLSEDLMTRSDTMWP